MKNKNMILISDNFIRFKYFLHRICIERLGENVVHASIGAFDSVLIMDMPSNSYYSWLDFYRNTQLMQVVSYLLSGLNASHYRHIDVGENYLVFNSDGVCFSHLIECFKTVD